MYTIGFTTKFYTLWDVTVEHFTNAYGRKGERVTANYIKNISMDEKAAEKYAKKRGLWIPGTIVKPIESK